MAKDTALQIVLHELKKDRAALRAAVGRVPAARRQQRPAPDRWSVSEVIEHLAIVEARSAAAIGAETATAPMLAQDSGAAPTEFDRTKVLDRSTKAQAPEFIQPQGHMDFNAAWSALEQAWTALDALITSAAGRDLTSIGRTHPFLGQLDGYQWLLSIGGHERRHTAQILEIADAIRKTAG